jgi:hypothetical protein
MSSATQAQDRMLHRSKELAASPPLLTPEKRRGYYRFRLDQLLTVEQKF